MFSHRTKHFMVHQTSWFCNSRHFKRFTVFLRSFFGSKDCNFEPLEHFKYKIWSAYNFLLENRVILKIYSALPGIFLVYEQRTKNKKKTNEFLTFLFSFQIQITINSFFLINFHEILISDTIYYTLFFCVISIKVLCKENICD